MNLKCLILKVKNIIYTIEIRDENYNVIKDRGEIRVDYTINYWAWWKEKLGYIDEKVDVLILSDEKFIIDKFVDDVKVSIWKIEDIIKCLNLIKEKEQSEIKVISYKGDIIEIILQGNKIKIEVNKKLEQKIIGKKIEEINENIEIKKEVPKDSIANYYKNKTQEFMKNTKN